MLSTGGRVSFVYDFLDASEMFEGLRFVMNAGDVTVLDGKLDEHQFKSKYGLPRKMAFVNAQPRQMNSQMIDWWEEVY